MLCTNYTCVLQIALFYLVNIDMGEGGRQTWKIDFPLSASNELDLRKLSQVILLPIVWNYNLYSFIGKHLNLVQRLNHECRFAC